MTPDAAIASEANPPYLAMRALSTRCVRWARPRRAGRVPGGSGGFQSRAGYELELIGGDGRAVLGDNAHGEG